jgi:hypothetical protein
MQGTNVRVNEFTVAQITPDVAYHTTSGLLNLNRWSTFAEAIDNEMRKQNIYYDDLIVGNILKK